MADTEIMKLQSDATGTRLLGYTEDRKFIMENEMPAALSLFMPPLSKCYAEVRIVGDDVEILQLLPRDIEKDW